jgi:hypothetical protein
VLKFIHFTSGREGVYHVLVVPIQEHLINLGGKGAGGAQEDMDKAGTKEELTKFNLLI